ncbi:MAG TPA: 3'-5' exonuclease [Luteibaculaceae bacterium]|nr:3'-5' exonuclease [Luteibaculaceae bacterium]
MQTEITKEELQSFPIQRFGGKIHLIDDITQVEQAIDSLRRFDILGFDTETKPSFKRGVVHKVALLQLASEDEAWIFRLNKLGFPQSLVDFLNENHRKIIGIAVHDDVKDLKKLNASYHPTQMVDLNKMATQLGYESIGAKKLSALVLGFTISKGEQTSNWEAKELSNGQLSYAATDAWICTLIYKKWMNL